ncbi:hypothetical protein GGF42_006204 [Coemansia sp. RSA 2424]|nr:hypothetical protein GGF42_006204 [Coemansia sp. RSA 2424]
MAEEWPALAAAQRASDENLWWVSTRAFKRGLPLQLPAIASKRIAPKQLAFATKCVATIKEPAAVTNCITTEQPTAAPKCAAAEQLTAATAAPCTACRQYIQQHGNDDEDDKQLVDIVQNADVAQKADPELHELAAIDAEVNDMIEVLATSDAATVPEDAPVADTAATAEDAPVADADATVEDAPVANANAAPEDVPVADTDATAEDALITTDIHPAQPEELRLTSNTDSDAAVDASAQAEAPPVAKNCAQDEAQLVVHVEALVEEESIINANAAANKSLGACDGVPAELPQTISAEFLVKELPAADDDFPVEAPPITDVAMRDAAPLDANADIRSKEFLDIDVNMQECRSFIPDIDMQDSGSPTGSAVTLVNDSPVADVDMRNSGPPNADVGMRDSEPLSADVNMQDSETPAAVASIQVGEPVLSTSYDFNAPAPMNWTGHEDRGAPDACGFQHSASNTGIRHDGQPFPVASYDLSTPLPYFPSMSNIPLVPAPDLLPLVNYTIDDGEQKAVEDAVHNLMGNSDCSYQMPPPTAIASSSLPAAMPECNQSAGIYPAGMLPPTHGYFNQVGAPLGLYNPLMWAAPINWGNVDAMPLDGTSGSIDFSLLNDSGSRAMLNVPLNTNTCNNISSAPLFNGLSNIDGAQDTYNSSNMAGATISSFGYGDVPSASFDAFSLNNMAYSMASAQLVGNSGDILFPPHTVHQDNNAALSDNPSSAPLDTRYDWASQANELLSEDSILATLFPPSARRTFAQPRKPKTVAPEVAEFLKNLNSLSAEEINRIGANLKDAFSGPNSVLPALPTTDAATSMSANSDGAQGTDDRSSPVAGSSNTTATDCLVGNYSAKRSGKRTRVKH